ncbi:hypothetical protein [Microbacterium sp. 77mftsu3.1]|uniref:hypothetical protein n=1 Tax=Microbacterium sp. 77mftsu3.1 TaxID=1761802 RepID=UPI00035D1D00|nr:hypothetical protein [Microbacterium sp. 77mftsu3.1]SDH51492.1 hypothetical protein SAMN04488590_3495 [Microbacterium sp. 77mftsu3.1]
MGLFSRKPKVNLAGHEVYTRMKREEAERQQRFRDELDVQDDIEAERHYIRGLEAYARSRTAPGTTIEHMDPEPFETSVAIGGLGPILVGTDDWALRDQHGIRGHFGHPAQFMLGVLAHDRGDWNASSPWIKQSNEYGLGKAGFHISHWAEKAKDGSDDDELTRARRALRRLMDDRVDMELARFHIPTDPWNAERTREMQLQVWKDIGETYYQEEAAKLDEYRGRVFDKNYRSIVERAKSYLNDGKEGYFVYSDAARMFDAYADILVDDWRDADLAVKGQRRIPLRTAA